MKKFAIIVAGGEGLRLGSSIPKQFLPIKERPLLFHTLEKFENIADEIILVLPLSHQTYWTELCHTHSFHTSVKVVAGGPDRTTSVLNGLKELDGEGIVAIHDAVRPLVSRNLVELLYKLAEARGNAVPAIAVKDSLRMQRNGENRAVNRSEYFAVQTPQCFDLQKLIKAYQNYSADLSFTDDASVFEHGGDSIHLVQGENTNIKITFPEDLIIAEALINATFV